MVVSSLVCSAQPASPFKNISSSFVEDGTLISWEYWGPEKNVYVEYIVKNSKQSISPFLFLSVSHRGVKRLLLHCWLMQVNINIGSHVEAGSCQRGPRCNKRGFL